MQDHPIETLDDDVLMKELFGQEDEDKEDVKMNNPWNED